MDLLLILLSLPALTRAAVGVAVPIGVHTHASSRVSSSIILSTPILTTPSIFPSATAAPSLDDCQNTTTISASCWDVLGMDSWMRNWNAITQCSSGEIWSDCFLRLGYGTPGYECSTIGSIYCSMPKLGSLPSEPHAFYGAYNIWAIWEYFSIWQNVLYAIVSQPAINDLVTTLNVTGAPKLTTNSLLAAIVANYGLDQDVDEWFIDILPSGPKAEPLDTTQTYMSTQLAGLLGDTLMLLSSHFWEGYFLLMVQHGQMMADTSETLKNLEASFAAKSATSVQPLTG